MKKLRWKIHFKNIFEFSILLKIEILMMRNFWTKINAKKFNKCERQKCRKNHKTLCNKVIICSILAFDVFSLVVVF